MLIYDGDCGFCTTCARQAEARLRIPIRVVPWQEIHDLGELGLSQSDVTTAAYFVDSFGRTYRGHLAVAKVLLQCKGAWPLAGALLEVPFVRPLAAFAYSLVARNRDRLPGATAACALPARRSFAPTTGAGT